MAHREINQEILGDLQLIFSERVKVPDRAEAAAYSRDLWTILFLDEKEDKIPNPPDLIVWPLTEAEIRQLVILCRKHKIPLVPYAGGSGVCGATVPVHGGITVDMKRMCRVIELNETDLTCKVEPGINGQVFEEYLNRHGYTLGHFPSSIYTSTVGGWVSTRAAGQLSTYYGKIEDMVISLEIILGSGEKVSTLSAPRSAQGVDFNQVFTGSEGTLGIFTTVTLKIHPYPAYRGYFSVKTGNVGDGIELMRSVIQSGLRPAAVRLYDEMDTAIIGSPSDHINPVEKKKPSQFKKIMKSFKEGKGLSLLLRWPWLINTVGTAAIRAMKSGCLLLFTFEGEKDLVSPQLDYLQKLAVKRKLNILGPAPAEYWWNHRYDVSYNTPSVLKTGAFLDTCEVAISWSRLEELYHRVIKAVSNEVFIMAHFSHIYMTGSNIYFSIVGYAADPDKTREKYFRVWDKMMGVCLEMGAAITHHHSVGLLKQEWFRRQLGSLHPLWHEIKKSCDPDFIMNPGKMAVSADE